MVPLLIGAAVAGAAAYKIIEGKQKKVSLTKTSTRYIPEEEVPPDVIEKIHQKELARLAKTKHIK